MNGPDRVEADYLMETGFDPRQAARLVSPDLIVTAGGGIMAHPDGPATGVAGLREAWGAAMASIPLYSYACEHPASARALEARAA